MNSTFPVSESSLRVGSRAGVDVLLAQACQRWEAKLLIEAFSPLLPEDCPWTSLSEIPQLVVKREGVQLSRISGAIQSFADNLTATAGRLSAWLNASDDDVREVALRYAKYYLPGQQKLAWAESRLGSRIPGNSVDSRMARINDARFWRRAIRVRLLREREHFYLRLRLIGRAQEAYVSDQQLLTRTRQLRQQKAWMEETVLVPRYLEVGEEHGSPLTLAKVASNPRTRFAKLYAFTKAMDEIGQAEGLAAGMLTLTLEPAWHPNPSHGTNTWNGASPREAHQLMAKRWQAILRDLDRAGVGLSGLRVVEPHKDSCPHWHLWILYRPEAEIKLMATVMKYFPNKLKVREPSCKGQKLHPNDRMFETRADLLAETGRPLTNSKEGAQVELSRIDRSISSGASYAMKYLLKTVDAGERLNEEIDLFGSVSGAELEKSRAAHQETAKRVDAFRGLWGINAGQLFGVAKCLSAWDELRRLTLPPTDNRLHALWVLARGSDKPGRIPQNAGQRGNPRAFIEALGGLAACGKPPKTTAHLSIERLTVPATNGYGEAIRRSRGISLVERRQRKVRKGQVDRSTGEIHVRAGWRAVKTVLASIVTRVTDWVLAPRRLHGAAVCQAQERAYHRNRAMSPVGLGKQARQHFWSVLWQAWERLCPEERYPLPA